MGKITTIAFDVDGTLVNPRTQEIDASTKDSIQALKEAGYRLLLSTGRCQMAAKSTGVFDLCQWDGYVFNNGQVVMDKDFKIIAKKGIHPEMMQDIIDEANQRHIALMLQSHRWHFVSERNHYVESVHDKLGTEIPKKEVYQGQEIFTFMIYGDDFSMLDKYPGLRVVKGHSPYGDVLVDGITKATGLQKLLNKDDSLLSFGDSGNDIEMLELSKIGVAMIDSPLALQKVATHLSQTEEDEIATMINRLQLL